jgi:seryl-tRNA(Sec) selenium transferase
MKVGREEIVGLITALRRYVAGSDEADLARWERLLDPVAQALEGVAGIRVSRVVPAHKPVPFLHIDVDGDHEGVRAYAVVNALLAGEPAIAVDQSHAERGRIAVNPQGLTEEETPVVAARLREELARVMG